MRLRVDGYDGQRGGYRVVRTYHPRKSDHAFAWFVDEGEAQRFCEIAVHLRDADEVTGIKAEEAAYSSMETRESPADLVGALQDKVHTDAGPFRTGRSVKETAAAPTPEKTGALDCEKCRGEGWCWGHQLDNPSEDTYADGMTRYSCDGAKCVALRDKLETPPEQHVCDGGWACHLHDVESVKERKP